MLERIDITPRYEDDAQRLFPPDRIEEYRRTIEEAIRRKSEFGQRVRGTANVQIWPLFPGDGFVYISYYRVEGSTAVLLGLTRRVTPLSPQLLNLED